MYNLTSKDKPPPTWGVIIRHYIKLPGPLLWIFVIILMALLYLTYARLATSPDGTHVSSERKGGNPAEDHREDIGPNLAVDKDGTVSDEKDSTKEKDGSKDKMSPDINSQKDKPEKQPVVEKNNLDVKQLEVGQGVNLMNKLGALNVNNDDMVHLEQKPNIPFNVHNHHLDEIDEDYIIAQQHNKDPNALPVLPKFDPNRHIHGALPQGEVFYPSPKIFPVPQILSPKVDNNCPQNHQFVLIVVVTTANQTKHRNAIRRTWGKSSNFKPVALRGNMRWWVVFTMGTVPGTEEIVREEQKTHGDILQGNFFDHPSEETRKTMQALKWAAEHLHESCRPLFLLKTECSVFVNTPLLTKWIGDHFSQSLSTYAGKLIRDDVPIRDLRSSLYVSERDYLRNVFPNFIKGPSFLLSMDVTTTMASLIHQVTPIAMEDAYIGLLAEKIQIAPMNVDKFQVTERPQNVCHYLEMMFIRTGKATVHHQIFMVVNHQDEKCTGVRDL